MKILLAFSIMAVLAMRAPANIATPDHARNDSIPSFCKGNFADDYDIRYTISDSIWLQQPNVVYHILKWNTKEQYLVARNDSNNPSEKGLYTRIDYMQFENMAPWYWGFCLTVYDAPSDQAAEQKAAADRKNPRKGCNGYPFSRMKRTDIRPGFRQ